MRRMKTMRRGFAATVLGLGLVTACDQVLTSEAPPKDSDDATEPEVTAPDTDATTPDTDTTTPDTDVPPTDTDVPDDDTDPMLQDLCGNAELDDDEVCDDGVNDGSYGSCLPDCSARAAYCGDGQPNGPEACDDGVNDGSYGGCEADCLTRGPYCGDADINGPETCDDGVNDDACESCRPDCLEVGSADFLTQVDVTSVPDAYGWPGDYWPDIFIVIYDAAGNELWVSDSVVDTNPPVSFAPGLIVDGEEWTIEVYDEDGGVFLDADDLGSVEIDTSQGFGDITILDLSVSFSVQSLLCD